MSGSLGEGLVTPAAGYSFVYHTEIGLLFVTLVILGPLVRQSGPLTPTEVGTRPMGLAEFPT
jgi:BCD family chlorophyll transporter-like MFS transporter